MVIDNRGYNLEVDASQRSFQFGLNKEGLAQIFKTLREGLYSNKFSFIRELLTNAYDAHIAAGISEKPFLIDMPDYESMFFKIRDFGIGLNEVNMQNIYAKYGESTKSDSNQMVGQFGLGCKSPFAYTEEFWITTYCDMALLQHQLNQQKKIYSDAVNSLEALKKFIENTPDIKIEKNFVYPQYKSLKENISLYEKDIEVTEQILNTLVKGDTYATEYRAFIDTTGIGVISKIRGGVTKEKRGVEIKVPIKSVDFGSVIINSVGFCQHFSVIPLLSRKNSIFEEKMTEAKSIVKSIIHSNFYVNKRGGTHGIIMGNVFYVVDYKEILKIDVNSPFHTKVSDLLIKGKSVVIKANIGDVDVVASREALLYSDKTVQYIINQHVKINQELIDLINAERAALKSNWENLVWNNSRKHQFPFSVLENYRKTNLNDKPWDEESVGTLALQLFCNKVSVDMKYISFSDRKRMTFEGVDLFQPTDKTILVVADEKGVDLTRAKVRKINDLHPESNLFLLRPRENFVYENLLSHSLVLGAPFIKLSEVTLSSEDTKKYFVKSTRKTTSGRVVLLKNLNDIQGGRKNVEAWIECNIDFDMENEGVFIPIKDFLPVWSTFQWSGVKESDWNMTNFVTLLHKFKRKSINLPERIYGFRSYSEDSKFYEDIGTGWITFKQYLEKEIDKVILEEDLFVNYNNLYTCTEEDFAASCFSWILEREIVSKTDCLYRYIDHLNEILNSKKYERISSLKSLVVEYSLELKNPIQADDTLIYLREEVSKKYPLFYVFSMYAGGHISYKYKKTNNIFLEYIASRK